MCVHKRSGDVSKSKLKSSQNHAFEEVCVCTKSMCYDKHIYTLSSTHRFVHNTHTLQQHLRSERAPRYAHDPPRNIPTAECTHNYKHVPPVMTVCVMGDINIGAVISPSPKISHDKVKDAVSPKAKEEDICLRCLVTPSQCQKFLHCLTRLSAATESGAETRRSEMSENISTVKSIPVVCFIRQHMLSGELIVKDPLQTCLKSYKYSAWNNNLSRIWFLHKKVRLYDALS